MAGLEGTVHTVVGEMLESLVWVLGCREGGDLEGRVGCVAPRGIAGAGVVLVAASVGQAAGGGSL